MTIKERVYYYLYSKGIFEYKYISPITFSLFNNQYYRKNNKDHNEKCPFVIDPTLGIGLS